METILRRLRRLGLTLLTSPLFWVAVLVGASALLIWCGEAPGTLPMRSGYTVQ